MMGYCSYYRTPIMFGKRSSNSGQILLLLILIMGTVIIVATTAMFQTTSAIKSTSANQISQSTAAAAEAGLERGITLSTGGSFRVLGLTNLSAIDLDTSFVDVTYTRSSEYISPFVVDEGDQHTLYLSDYDLATNTFSTPYAVQFQTYWESSSGNCQDRVLQMTLIYDENGDGVLDSKTMVADGSGSVLAVSDPLNYYSATLVSPAGKIDGYEFKCVSKVINVGLYSGAKYLLTQVLNGSSKVGFAVAGQGQFPAQGRLVTATAHSLESTSVGAGTPTPAPISNYTRSVSVFQSFPQIPAGFWNTRY
jgi:hypothetical protein